MKPDKFSVFDLFENKKRYIVPLFQRPYVWTKEEQWAPLWEDITYKSDQIIDRESYRDGVGSHFLGAAVVNEIHTYGHQVRTYEIIDGQQRLTTLQILLKAFRDFLRSIGYEEFEYDLARLTANQGMKAEETEQYKVWPTTADRSAYTAVLDADGFDTLRQRARELDVKTLADAYLFFYNAIDEYVQYGENNDEIDSPRYEYDSEMARTRIEALMEALRRHLEIVMIELEEDDDPQIIFETLNARGVPLLPSDLIRNFVFLQASNAGEDIEELYNQYWLPFDDQSKDFGKFWKSEEERGRQKSLRIDLFIFYYLTMKTGRDIKLPHLFQEFQRWWAASMQMSPALTVEDLLRDLQAYSYVYYDLVNAHPKTRLGTFIYRLEKMRTATVYPLLLYLYGHEQRVDPAEQLGIVIDLESYLVRRLVCGLTGKNYNRNFLSVLRDLGNAEEVTRDAFREIMLAFEGDASRWPSDDEFRQQWLYKRAYGRISQGRVEMILAAVDLEMETAKQEALHIDGRLTIEHIFPQNPKPGAWPELDDPNIIDTFGNLTLLTTSLNSSVSNGPFLQKRQDIARQSKLRMNAEFQDLAGQTEWTVEDIIRRGDHLFEYACRIWPRPSDPEGRRFIAGQMRALDSLREVAYESGIGETFDVLIEAGLQNSLYASPSSRSVMFTAQHHKVKTLFTVWAKPREGRCRIYIATGTFPELFPLIDEQAAYQHLGEEGWREMYLEDAKRFAEELSALLSTV